MKMWLKCLLKTNEKAQTYLYGRGQRKINGESERVGLRGASPNNMHAVSAELRVFGLKKETIDNRFSSPKSCRTSWGGGAGDMMLTSTPGTELTGIWWAFPPRPWWGQDAAVAGLESNSAEPPQNTPWDGRVSQPQSRASKIQDTALWQGCGWCITRRGLVVPPLGAAARQGSNREVSEVFPLGGMGGCFYINLPRGEVQRPSYRKCKPYVGSLAEQTHLYVIHTARQRKWRSTC